MTLETQVLGASVWWWMRSILCLHFQDPIALSSSRKSTPRVGWLIEHVSGITDVLQPPSAHLSLDSSPKADVLMCTSCLREGSMSTCLGTLPTRRKSRGMCEGEAGLLCTLALTDPSTWSPGLDQAQDRGSGQQGLGPLVP